MEGQSAALPNHLCLDRDEKDNELLEPFMYDSEEEIRKWRANGVDASEAARRATRFEEAQFKRDLESGRFFTTLKDRVDWLEFVEWEWEVPCGWPAQEETHC